MGKNILTASTPQELQVIKAVEKSESMSSLETLARVCVHAINKVASYVADTDVELGNSQGRIHQLMVTLSNTNQSTSAGERRYLSTIDKLNDVLRDSSVYTLLDLALDITSIMREVNKHKKTNMFFISGKNTIKPEVLYDVVLACHKAVVYTTKDSELVNRIANLEVVASALLSTYLENSSFIKEGDQQHDSIT